MVANLGGVDLGSAYGKIIISDNVDEAVGRAQRSFDAGLRGIGASMQNFGNSLSNVGGALTTLTAPLVAIGAVGLNVASNFDTVMKQIEVFGDLAPADLEAVRQAALKFGADTKFTAQDAANAMLDLLKSGQDMTQTLSTMPAVLNLAGAGNINLAQSAGMVSTALAQFQMDVEESGRVADALTRAANASRAEVSDLGLALVNVGPTAAQFGLSIEDTAAALAVLADNGIMGAEAGTQLRTMLSQLARPTADNEAAFAKLGMSLYDVNGNVIPLNNLLREMKFKMKDLPVKDQIELTQALAGAYGSTALRALLASDGIYDMTQAMEAAPGAATVAATFMDTFAGKVESLRGSVETLMITALTPFMNDVLAPLADRLIVVVNGISEWAAANPELVTQIVSLVAAVAGLGTGMWAAGRAISAIGTLLTALTSPIGIIIATIAALVWAFQTNFLGFRDTVESVVHFITEVLAPKVQAFFDSLGAGKSLQEAFHTAFPEVEAAWDTFWTVTLPAGWEEFKRIMGEQWDLFWNTTLPNAADSLRVWITDSFWPSFRATVESAWNDFSVWLGEQWDLFWGTTLPDILNTLGTFFSETFWPTVRIIVEGAWNDFSAWLGEQWDLFWGTTLPNLVNAGWTWITEVLWPAFRVAIETAWESLKTTLETAWNTFWTVTLPNFINTFRTTIELAWSTFRTNIENTWNTLKANIEGAWNTFWTVTLPNAIRTGVAAMLGSINELLAAIGGLVNTSSTGLNPEIFPWAGQGRQFGGMVGAGLPYLVGEAGPELFVPRQSGSIVPNHALGGGIEIGQVVIHANSRADGEAAAESFAARLEELRMGRGN